MVALGIVIDRKCNIRCGHCCFSSHPKANEHLTDEEILDIAKQGCELPNIDTIALSGGEALLRKSLVLKVLRMARDHGKRGTLVTNGFWGHNKKRAKETLVELKEAGLRAIKISFDDFHQDLLKVEKVKNILDANLSVRIPISLNVAVSKDHMSDGILAALGESLVGVLLPEYTFFNTAFEKPLKTLVPDSGEKNVSLYPAYCIYHRKIRGPPQREVRSKYRW